MNAMVIDILRPQDMEKIWSQVVSPEADLGKQVVLWINSPSATQISNAGLWLPTSPSQSKICLSYFSFFILSLS